MQEISTEKGGFCAHRLGEVKRVMDRYLEDGQAAGIITAVYRNGGVCSLDKAGYADLESQKPLEYETIFRIYSMTKPVTSVAIMMLLEQGKLRINDPLSRFLPQFKEMSVYVSENEVVPAKREITIKDLLTHTSGLSYADFENPAPAPIYAESKLLAHADGSSERFYNGLAALPLLYHPGEVWHYSLATDVLGGVVEAISGLTLGQYFQRHIFEPLGMVDTHFYVPEEKLDRFATLYGEKEDGSMGLVSTDIAGDFTKPRFESGGGGLISTVSDYMRFAQLILNKGEFDGVRLLGRKTVDHMTANHLPQSMLPIALGEEMPGIGFGLGFSRVLSPQDVGVLSSVGNHGWGGWASTHFWVDPVEEMIGLIMVQYIAQNNYFLSTDIKTAVYQALL